MKKSLLFLSIILSLFIFSACSDGGEQAVADDAEIILFSSDSCPHCKNVKEYIEKNKIKEKVEFSEREVGISGEKKSNANLMTKKQKECKIESQYVGSIPFLWTKDGKCLMGDEDIIKFFGEKAGIN